MKLFEHNQGGGNNTECGSWYYDKKVCEFNNKIYIRQQGHTKTDLKPLFNDYFGMSAYNEPMSLHNKIGMGVTQHAPTWYKGLNSSNVWYHDTHYRMYHLQSLDGQVEACAAIDGKGFKLEEFYESDEGHIFYNEQTRNDNEILIKKDPKTMKNVAVNVHNNQLLRNMRVIHETDDYLFAIHGGNTYSHYAGGFIRILKSDCTWSRRGWHGRHTYGYQPIYKNDDYILSFVWEANYSSSQPGFSLHKHHWDDSQTNNTGRYLRKDGITAAYSNLQWLSADDVGNPNPSTSLSSRTSIYYPMEDAHRMSDGSAFIPKDGFYSHAGAAMVADETLRNTHNVGRMYVAYFEDSTVDESEPLAILRINVPIGDSVPDAPEYDVRKCELNHSGASDPDADVPTWVNVHKEGGRNGSASWIYREQNLHYFRAENSGGGTSSYLLLTFEDSSGFDTHNQTYHQFGDRFYVYKIDDDSVSADITETDSIDLTLVQTENLDNPILGKFFPGGHAGGFEKFVLLNYTSAEKNPVYVWDSATENFITEPSSDGIVGPITSIGEDSTGRIFSVRYPSSNTQEMKQEIHIDSIDLPHDVKIVPEQASYNYVGSTIDTFVNVSVYDAEGNRLNKSVALTIVGSGVNFTGGGSTKTVSTSTSADTKVDIQITSASRIQMTATIS